MDLEWITPNTYTNFNVHWSEYIYYDKRGSRTNYVRSSILSIKYSEYHKCLRMNHEMKRVDLMRTA